MELSTWNVQEYELTDSDGEKAVILFRPLTQGWRVVPRSDCGIQEPDHRRRGPIKGRSDLGGHRNRDPRPGTGSAHHLRGPRIGVRGKRLRAAFQYVAKGEPSPEEADLWEKSGWTGCKLWGSCGGTRCKDGDPDEKGRLRFRTPVLMPRDRPQGCHPVDRRLSACPLRECDLLFTLGTRGLLSGDLRPQELCLSSQLDY